MHKIDESIIKIFNNLGSYLVFILENEKILFVSKNIYEIINFKEKDLIGKEIKEFLTDKEEFLNFKKNIETKRENFRIKLKDKRDNIKVFDCVLFNIENDKNLLILKDITEDLKKETLNKIFYTISNLVYKIKNLRELCECIHRLIKEYIYAENFYISLINESGNYIYFPYFVDLKDEIPGPRKRRGGLTEYILEKGEPILLKRDEIEKLREEGKLIFYGTCPEYYIGAPLKVFNKLIGVIAIQIYEKNIIYTQDDLNLIAFISEQISFAIERLKMEEQYNSLIKNIKGFVFIITLEEDKINVAEIKGNFEELTGYKKDEFLSEQKDFMFLIYKEDYKKVKKLFMEVIESKDKTFTEIIRIITKNYEIKWASINLSTLGDEIPEVKVIQGIITDITESVKTKERLYETESKFKRILDNSKDIFYRYTLYPKRGFEYINEIVTKITGYTPDDYYSDPDLGFKIVHPDDRILLQKIVSGEVDGPIVLRWISKDGKLIFIEQNNWFIKDEDGKIIAIEGIARDVTERKILEESLRENEELFRAFFEHSPVGITMCDQEGKVLISNNAFCKMIGYSLEEIREVSWREYTYPEDIEKDWNLFKKLINREIDSYSIEKRFIRKDGKIIYARLNCVAVFDEKGDFKFELAIIEDITEDKRLREEIEENRRKLAKSLDNILNLITKIIEMKDPYTLGHQARVAYLAIKIAKKMNLPEDMIEKIRIASFLHDIGKLTIPSEVLNKGGTLSESEYSLLKEHSINGYKIIEKIEYLKPIADIVLQHHERLNGSGYPLGLKDDEILLEARIIAVCDVFEAMTSHRPYRPAFSVNEALKELKENRGILYDPQVVDILENLIINKEIQINFSNRRNKS